MDTFRIGVLGPIEAYLAGCGVRLGGRKEQLLLAALAVVPNQTVSTDSLLEGIWNGVPPSSGLDTLQSMVSRLRRRLGHDVLELVDHSYRLVVEPEQVDSIRFERLLGDAASLLAEDPSAASALATDALVLWRGTPFGDLGNVSFLEPEVWRLEALRQSALEVQLEADVACGRHASAIAGLQAEVARNPYRERLWYLLVLALARDGRRVDALQACDRLRAELAATGLKPTADIYELEQMVLTEAPAVRSLLRR